MRGLKSIFIISLFIIPCELTSMIFSNNHFQYDALSKTPIYTDQTTKVRYADKIIIKLKKELFLRTDKNSYLNVNNIKNAELRKICSDLLNKYGKIKLLNFLPSNWTTEKIARNKRTRKVIQIPDWSQVYHLIFQRLVPIDSIISKLERLRIIEYAEEPFQAITCMIPGDPHFQQGNSWAFEKIHAEEAWDLTRGDSKITIGIIDWFGRNGDSIIHEDLENKVRKHFGKFGNHGRIVSGVAGAHTDNNKGVASLGWNLSINYYDATYPVIAINNAIADNVDVINFSWYTKVDLSYIRDAVKTALSLGIVCVAASGNNKSDIPDTLYPAAYNFGEIGQVIAVSATMCDGIEETSVEGWNYSPGDDPLNEPISSFIDVAAPGCDINILDKTCCSKYSIGCGTSIAAPFVSALAGLILSVDSFLTPPEVYSIITSTADKIGSNKFNNIGWNQYVGYGRINAFKALNKIKYLVNLSAEKEIYQEKKILFQNYPNPFNKSTNIQFTIVKSSPVTIEVYDLLGRKLTTLLNEYKLPGKYQIQFIDETNIAEAASGVYLFCIETEYFRKTIKAILLK